MVYKAKNLEILLLKQKNSKMGQIIGKYRPALMETVDEVKNWIDIKKSE